MAYQLSPGVEIQERDFTNIIPGVATTAGGFAGAFTWGPVMEPKIVSSRGRLASWFGRPNDDNAIDFWVASNFLQYSNHLKVVRVDTENHRNAVAVPAGAVSDFIVALQGSSYTKPTVTLSAPNLEGGIQATGSVVTAGTYGVVHSTSIVSGGSGYTTATVNFEASPTLDNATANAVIDNGVIVGITITNAGSGYITTPTITIDGDGNGASVTCILGKVIADVVITNPGSGYTTPPTVTINDVTGSGASVTATVAVGGIKIKNIEEYEDNYFNGAASVGLFAAKYPGRLGNSIKVSMADSATYASWEYKEEFEYAPGSSQYVIDRGGSNDELHIIVIDADGRWTGIPGRILQKLPFLSKCSGARKDQGERSYYKDVLKYSNYIWWMDHPTGAQVTEGADWGSTATNSNFASLTAPITVTLSGGADDLSPTDGQIQEGYQLFDNVEKYDVSLLVAGALKPAVYRYISDNVVDVRKDCLLFVSPTTATGERISGSSILENTVNFRNSESFNLNTSFVVIDSGWKYMYDSYNDKYRWVPLSGDIAGLVARTELTNDAWWSPGGFNRGQIKGAIKLSFNPNKTERDELYRNGINPVVSFPGQGTVLYGDKTALNKPSAFDRINVRRLFIVLEKAISTAAKYQLFEFNDAFTRTQFRSMVEPFLRDIQGRRGIVDFRVICDDTNNTGEVIDRNEFVADIYIKPTRSINFINLNFIAVRSSVSFQLIGG